MHGPCGVDNPNSPCMENGHCSKKYPMAFTDETKNNEDGYPQYRRRQGREYVRGVGANAIIFDNRHVVPYNLWLSTKYDAHINVEICSSVTAVKYLYKYVYKGPDRVEVGVGENVNEISAFVDARYISACESLWRIYGFPLHAHSPNIERLPVHQENGQSI
jgi:hypothetical protein